MMATAFAESRNLTERYDAFSSRHFADSATAEYLLFAAVYVGLYWTHGLLYLVLDLTERPRFLQRFKIQPNTSHLSGDRLAQLARRVLLNQTLTLLVAYPIFQLRHQYTAVQREVPALGRLLCELPFFLLLTEVLFYYCHRALHHGSVYRFSHKVHHEWQTVIAVEAMYAHPLEHLLMNFGIELLGPLLLRSHPLTLTLWFAFVVVINQIDHSGYVFPLNPFPPAFHDYHHLKFTSNYGLIGLMDWLHGTDIAFKQSKYYALNRINWSLTQPIQEKMY